jgi:hypothetical protein
VQDALRTGELPPADKAEAHLCVAMEDMLGAWGKGGGGIMCIAWMGWDRTGLGWVGLD